MSYSGSSNSGGGVQPHAFDPLTQPELFRGVLTRRVFAFLIDLVVLSIPVILACMFVAVFGLLTLGLGWVLFWLSVSMLTPLVLLLGLFNGRRRLLHDLILGTIVINSSVRTQVAQAARTF